LSALSSFVVTAANVGFPELLLVGSQVQRIHTFRPMCLRALQSSENFAAAANGNFVPHCRRLAIDPRTSAAGHERAFAGGPNQVCNTPMNRH
jgi:hypothetical protein